MIAFVKRWSTAILLVIISAGFGFLTLGIFNEQDARQEANCEAINESYRVTAFFIAELAALAGELDAEEQAALDRINERIKVRDC